MEWMLARGLHVLLGHFVALIRAIRIVVLWGSLANFVNSVLAFDQSSFSSLLLPFVVISQRNESGAICYRLRCWGSAWSLWGRNLLHITQAVCFLWTMLMRINRRKLNHFILTFDYRRYHIDIITLDKIAMLVHIKVYWIHAKSAAVGLLIAH